MCARTVEEFGACLRQLKVWAGGPSFQELRRRTGIPSSTLADALSPWRTRLPRLDIVRSFVRACGGLADDVARWEYGWRRVQERQDAAHATREPPRATRPRQLPRSAAHFVGREGILDLLHELQRQQAVRIRRSPLALLVGPAGTGKTAAALFWGHRVASGYPDGQLFIDLRGAAETAAVTAEEALPLFLYALGVPSAELPAGVGAQASLYRSITYSRRLLVVLDNVRDAEHVRPLLPGGPWCFTLVTSRDRLSGLVAREDGVRVTLDPLCPAEAERLIGLMLHDQRPAAEPDATRELSRMCGYLPIALRIAAANLADRPGTPISAYAAQLAAGNRLAQLSVAGDESTAVKAAFDLSYATLDDATRRMFRRLPAAPDQTFTLEEAALPDCVAPAEAGRRLEALVAAHLVERAGADRYALHDLVRLYAENLALDEPPPLAVA
jgi:hypothetical protein